MVQSLRRILSRLLTFRNWLSLSIFANLVKDLSSFCFYIVHWLFFYCKIFFLQQNGQIEPIIIVTVQFNTWISYLLSYHLENDENLPPTNELCLSIKTLNINMNVPYTHIWNCHVEIHMKVVIWFSKLWRSLVIAICCVIQTWHTIIPIDGTVSLKKV